MQHTRTTKLLGMAIASTLVLAAACKKEEARPTQARLSGAPGAPPDESADAPAPPTRPALPVPAKKSTPDAFGEYACRLMKGCYTKHGAFGQVGGRITVTVGADGKATSAAYDQGTAPDAVKECIVAAGKLIQLTDFSAGAGELVCEYSGQLLSGDTERMSKSWKFVPKK